MSIEGTLVGSRSILYTTRRRSNMFIKLFKLAHNYTMLSTCALVDSRKGAPKKNITVVKKIENVFFFPIGNL